MPDVVRAWRDGSDVVIRRPHEPGDTVTVGEESFKVIHTPGHTPGHVVFFHADARLARIDAPKVFGKRVSTHLADRPGDSAERETRTELVGLSKVRVSTQAGRFAAM